MRLALLALAAFVWSTATPAMAGPNAGGVLLVHDTGLVYTYDTPGPPYGGTVPTSCQDVVIEAPTGDGTIQLIWKVYAAFPAGSSPRLAGLAWGMDLVPDFDGFVVTGGGGQVNPLDFQVYQDGWPTTDGASIGQSFPVSGTKTALMNEVYWFYGYGYGGASGLRVPKFCAQPASEGQSNFADDAPIKNTDPIAGFGCLGFGGPGFAPCPGSPLPSGSCCDATGACAVTVQANCTAGVWTLDGRCNPNPCPQPGTCCAFDGTCAFVFQSACSGVWTLGGACDPNPCPPGGACCNSTGVCEIRTQATCPGPRIWQGANTTCNPNPCLLGACCVFTTCHIYSPIDCAGNGGVYFGNGTLCVPADTCLTSGVGEGTSDLNRLRVLTAPNPSAAPVVIRCLVPARSPATVVLFDAVGRVVRRLHDGELPAGETAIAWDGRDDGGRALPSGVYLVKVTTPAGETAGRMVLTR